LGEGHVMGDQTLAVAEHRAGDAEESDRDDGDHEVEHGRLLGGTDDEPGGREQQSDRGGPGRDAECDAAEELHAATSTIRSASASVSGRWVTTTTVAPAARRDRRIRSSRRGSSPA